MDQTKKRKIEEAATNGTQTTTSEPNTTNITALTSSDIRKIIEPLTKEELVDIVQMGAIRHGDVLESVRLVADRDQSQRKLFVRGLGWDTTTDKLKSLFSTYGELDEAAVINDKATGKSKGFAFVTFRHVDGAIMALKEPSKKIDGRMTVSQLASAGTGGGGNAVATQVPIADASRKIYVGNVPYEMAGDRLLAHFLSYGEIEEGPLGYDKATGKSKGYALFVYKTAEAARSVLVEPIKTIDGVQLTCKLANPSDGKKGKPMGPTGGPVDAQQQMPGQFSGPGQYGPPGGPYGGGYTGGMHGPPPLGHNPMNSQPPASMSGYGSSAGGPYGGSQYDGPGSGGYSGLGPVGGYGSSGGGVGGGYGASGGVGGGYGASSGGVGGGYGASSGGAGLGGGYGGSSGGGAAAGGRGGSMYGGPPGSGAYNQSAHYSSSSSGYGAQQPSGTSPVPRGPPGMYPGGPQFY